MEHEGDSDDSHCWSPWNISVKEMEKRVEVTEGLRKSSLLDLLIN